MNKPVEEYLLDKIVELKLEVENLKRKLDDCRKGDFYEQPELEFPREYLGRN